MMINFNITDILDIVSLQDIVFRWLGFFVTIFVIQLSYKIFMKILYSFLIKKSKDIARTKTFFNIIKDFFKYVLYIVYLLLFLNTIGISVAVLAAGFGAASVIIGIAAQKIILDIFNGFFVLFENYFTIGDYIKVGEYEGYVEDFRIRSTFLKTFNNEIVILPNSEVSNIINYSKNNSNVYHDIEVSSTIDNNKIEDFLVPQILEDVKQFDNILEIDYLGIEKFNENTTSLKFVIECNPEERFSAIRELNATAKYVLDKNNIQKPYQNFILHQAQ